ncbi:MAG TPA: substrate-binding domain-containing protein [Candidatus Dormibacteraeota bacterium]|nr:substrate-binding domain-containing protein [Candidatus Dormibacteraeota bacterium]
MLRRFLILSVAVAVIVATAGTPFHAQDLGSLPHYRPKQIVSGTIRIWGNDSLGALMKSLQRGFSKYHRDVRFDTNLMGTGTAMAGIYTGVADLALMGRRSTAKEIMGFEWVFQYKPLELEVMTGSLNAPGKSPALVIFVNKVNPVSQLTLAQLDGIFGCEHRRGPSNIQTWGQLGLQGEWADKFIQAYAYDAETGPGSFFQQVVLNDSRKWNWDRVKEFKDMKRADGSVYDSGQLILDALAADRYGIAVSNLGYSNSEVKPLALAVQARGPYYEVSKGNLVRRTYPLTRGIYAYINRVPNKPVDPKVKEFLFYLLSFEGQRTILEDQGFLPLTQEIVRECLKKLE